MKLKESNIRWIGILGIGLLLPLVVELGDGTYPYQHTALVATIYSFFFWQGCAIIIFGFRRWFPHYKDTQRRIIYTFFLISIYTFLGGIIVDTILFSLGVKDESCLFLPFPNFLLEFRRDFILTFTVSTIYETTYFFGKWKEALVEAEQLKNQHIRSQFEVLKNQVSPHFLFNSLNTLITIIPEDPEAAVKFTENLSRVYRYILQNKDKELVSLETELEFIRSYVFLLKMRFGENLHVHYQIKEELLNHHVAPLTLQMLVENAIKHNIISREKPLHIDIYVENNQSVIVSNNLQRKNQVRSSTKIGLDNIIKRYKYLSDQAVDIITTASSFMVALPLIKLDEHS